MNIGGKIIAAFKKHPDAFLSGEEISRSLGITRQAFWKHIEKLREVGYVVEAVPHLGYRLGRIPEKILVPEIKWNLKAKSIGKNIAFYESVGSTNDVAYELASTGAEEGSVVIADRQTKGKGRLGRRWSSPPESGIYLSCILRPDILPNEISKITLLTAVSIVKAVRAVSGLEALIKWPNDVLVSGKKVSGVLTELKSETDKVNFAVLGMGINVNTPKRFLPKQATSLKEEGGKTFFRAELIGKLLSILEEEYIRFKGEGFSGIRDEFKDYSCTLGRYVTVNTGSGRKFEGEAFDIEESGALLVRMENGTCESFLSGDVTLVR